MAYPYIKAKSLSYGGSRKKKDIKYIVIHYTGNNKDTAKNNASYFHNGNQRYGGAHFFVDQFGSVYKSIPMSLIAWSVGDYVTTANGAGSYHGKCRNANSVSIELCDCASKDPSQKMIKAVTKLIAYIRKYCPNAKTVIRHWDVSGKNCPGRMTGTTAAGRKRWKNFLEAIDEKTKTSSSIPAYPTANLSKGSAGVQVKSLQKCMNKLIKANLKIDGSFGNATEKAVKSFQKKYKLEVDGICGPKTREKIRSLL